MRVLSHDHRSTEEISLEECHTALDQRRQLVRLFDPFRNRCTERSCELADRSNDGDASRAIQEMHMAFDNAVPNALARTGLPISDKTTFEVFVVLMYDQLRKNLRALA